MQIVHMHACTQNTHLYSCVQRQNTQSYSCIQSTKHTLILIYRKAFVYMNMSVYMHNIRPLHRTRAHMHACVNYACIYTYMSVCVYECVCVCVACVSITGLCLELLQHSNATYCNNTALQHALRGKEVGSVRNSNTLQHTATHCNALQHTLRREGVGSIRKARHCNTLQHTATHGSTLQYTAMHYCSTLQPNLRREDVQS